MTVQDPFGFAGAINWDVIDQMDDEQIADLADALDIEDGIEPPVQDWPSSADVAPCITSGGHLVSQRHHEDECPMEDGYDEYLDDPPC